MWCTLDLNNAEKDASAVHRTWCENYIDEEGKVDDNSVWLTQPKFISLWQMKVQFWLVRKGFYCGYLRENIFCCSFDTKFWLNIKKNLTRKPIYKWVRIGNSLGRLHVYCGNHPFSVFQRSIYFRKFSRREHGYHFLPKCQHIKFKTLSYLLLYKYIYFKINIYCSGNLHWISEFICKYLGHFMW